MAQKGAKCEWGGVVMRSIGIVLYRVTTNYSILAASPPRRLAASPAKTVRGLATLAPHSP